MAREHLLCTDATQPGADARFDNPICPARSRAGQRTDHLEFLGWRLIFLPNPRLRGGGGGLIGRYFLPFHRRRPDVTATDWPRHQAAVALSLICLQTVLSRGQIDDWLGSPRLQHLAFASAASLALLRHVAVSARNPAPLLRLDLLRDRNVVASGPDRRVHTGIILSGSLYVLPEYLRNVATVRHRRRRPARSCSSTR